MYLRLVSEYYVPYLSERLEEGQTNSPCYKPNMEQIWHVCKHRSLRLDLRVDLS